ncbi:MAG TPA: lipocalin-like domain-containing protein, partial [Anaerolineales bacterium]|nr:lipocalin-like domain-containing protein [Anaerolineales bacterium]
MSSNTIVGEWRLVTFEFRKEDNSIIYPFGKEARGSFIYTGSGRFSVQLMRIDRPKFAIPDQMRGTPEETEASYKGSISYFGTYQVDVDHGVINHFVEGSIFPNMEGTQQKRFYELDEDQLILKTPSFKVGGERATGIIVWE